MFNYLANEQLVHHVLNMDGVSSQDVLHDRAVTNVATQHVLYDLIIAWEVLTSIVLWVGLFFLVTRIKREDFQKHKLIATIGLSMILFLYAFGFMVLGSGWFQMWMTKWNALPTTMGMFTCVGITLLWLTAQE
tara:strand:- start:5169 stop:5567 length:399 start_codon:yes stop_codon:yes gene_type:complete